MEPKTLDATEAKARILQMLDKEMFVSLATFGMDDYPDVRVLVVSANDGVETIWFSTGTDSSKIAQLRKNPKAAIYGYDMEAMVEFRLFGTVELLSDAASRRKVWKDDYTQHWPDGVDSPDMIVLRFNTDHGVFDSYSQSGKF